MRVLITGGANGQLRHELLRTVPAGVALLEADAPRLDVGQLSKVVSKPVHRAAVVTGPKSGFADRDASHPRQRFVVVGGSRNHVQMRIDVVHYRADLAGVC